MADNGQIFPSVGEKELFFTWLRKHGGAKLAGLAEKNLHSRSPAGGGPKKLETIKKIVVHGSGFAAGNAKLFGWYHRLANRWDDIGYHFVIGNGKGQYSRDGEIQAGRALEFQGAHVKGHNHDSLAVCLVAGNGEDSPVTPLQRHALGNLLFHLCITHCLAPSRVFGHRELAQKNCPSPALDMDALRASLAARLKSNAARPGRVVLKPALDWPQTDLCRRETRELFRTMAEGWTQSGITTLLLKGHWYLDDPRFMASLRAMVETAREAGLDSIVYTGPYGAEPLKTVREQKHLSQWVQTHADGSIATYGGLPFFCPNSPYLEQWRQPLILKTLAACDFTGVFLDIPWFMRGACHCPFCLARAKRQGVALGDSFRQSSVRETLARLVLAIRQKHPQAQLAVNGNAPGTGYELSWTGAKAGNLNGLFDCLVTELTPPLSRAGRLAICATIKTAGELCPGSEVAHFLALDKLEPANEPGQFNRLIEQIHECGAGLWFSTAKLPGRFGWLQNRAG